MSYYDKVHYVAAVDKDDNIIGRVEKWEAHKKGILHRAFTVGLKFEDSWIIQHRKHPVFDSVLDVSCSSHPIYTDNNESELEDMPEAVVKTLEREWNIDQEITVNMLRHGGSAYYKAPDTLSDFSEHEICHFYSIELSRVPTIVDEFAYGMSVLPQKLLLDDKNILKSALAPWVGPLLTFVR